MAREHITLAVVTDIHNGPRQFKKPGHTALAALREFVAGLGTAGTDLVVEMGDRINDVDYDSDRLHLGEVAEVFRAWDGPLYHLIGNHDVFNMDRTEIAEVLGRAVDNIAVSFKGWRLIFWQPSVVMSERWTYPVDQADLDWLDTALTEADGPAVIFTHIPLHGEAMTGNPYFENRPTEAQYEGAEALRAKLVGNSKVVLCVSGHAHLNDLRVIDGLPFVTVQSLTDTGLASSEPALASAQIKLGKDIAVEIYGRDPMVLRLPIRTDVGPEPLPPR